MIPGVVITGMAMMIFVAGTGKIGVEGIIGVAVMTGMDTTGAGVAMTTGMTGMVMTGAGVALTTLTVMTGVVRDSTFAVSSDVTPDKIV